MCGISGAFIQNNKAKIDLNYLKDSLLNAVQSGKHSSGLYIEYKTDRQPITFHNVGTMHELLNRADVEQALNKNVRLVLGHTRQASIGAITLTNAQPFVEYPYVLLHNGHIQGLGSSKYSDSKELSIEVGRYGIKAVRQYVDRGWVNLVIYNILNKELYLIPDINRPRLSYVKNRGSLYFASENSWIDYIGNPTKLTCNLELKTGTRLSRKIRIKPIEKKVIVHNTTRGITDRYDRRLYTHNGNVLTHSEYQDLKRTIGY